MYRFRTHTYTYARGVCVEEDVCQRDCCRTLEKLIEPASILEIQPTLRPTPRNRGLNTNSQLAALFYTVAFTADRKEEIPGEVKFLGKRNPWEMECGEDGRSQYHGCSVWTEKWKLLCWPVF